MKAREGITKSTSNKHHNLATNDPIYMIEHAKWIRNISTNSYLTRLELMGEISTPLVSFHMPHLMKQPQSMCSGAVTWQPMVQFTQLNMQNGLLGHSRSICNLNHVDWTIFVGDMYG